MGEKVRNDGYTVYNAKYNHLFIKIISSKIYCIHIIPFRRII